MITFLNIPDGLAGQLDILGQTEILVRVQDIKKMVRYAGEFLKCGFGCGDVQVAVDLAAVGVNYFSPEF